MVEAKREGLNRDVIDKFVFEVLRRFVEVRDVGG